MIWTKLCVKDHVVNLGWSRKLSLGFQKPRRKFNYQALFFPKFQFCPDIEDIHFPLAGYGGFLAPQTSSC